MRELALVSATTDVWSHDVLPIAAVLVAAFVVSWLGHRVVRWSGTRLESSASASETISRQRRTTITRAISSAVSVVVWAVAILVVLVRLRVDIRAALTTAGLAGLVIAFGAQNFVRDVVAGFFVVLENHYDVGDRVVLHTGGEEPIEGWVQNVSFRGTRLELEGGSVANVGHGQVLFSINRSRGRGGAAVTIRVPEGVDADEVRREVDRALEEIRDERGLSRMVFGAPRVEEERAGGGSTLAVRVEARPERQHEVEAEVRRRLTGRLASVSRRIEVEGDGSGPEHPPRDP